MKKDALYFILALIVLGSVVAGYAVVQQIKADDRRDRAEETRNDLERIEGRLKALKENEVR